jgi:hypothetical protein
MDLKKLRLIGYLELLVTLSLMYFNWVTFYHIQALLANFNLCMGIVNFMLILVFLMATSPIYFSTFNPINTFYLYFFDQISRKHVG